jgi:D-glycero-D-manno-heptose 1,7-bisphosphate phosphatase
MQNDNLTAWSLTLIYNGLSMAFSIIYDNPENLTQDSVGKSKSNSLSNSLSKNKAKAVFLDRDGVINVDHGYVSEPDKFEFIGGVFEACKRFYDAGYLIVVVTNQSGIGRGYYDEIQFEAVSDWMVDQFNQKGVPVASVHYCPHHPEKANKAYLKACDCRKPQPGMLLDAIKQHNIDPAQSVMIGDKISDMGAARSANVQHKFLVRSGQTFSDQTTKSADAVYDDLLAVAKAFLAN